MGIDKKDVTMQKIDFEKDKYKNDFDDKIDNILESLKEINHEIKDLKHGTWTIIFGIILSIIFSRC